MTKSAASPLFNQIVIVDWSASNSPKRGADSIWVADSDGATLNPPTRSNAIIHIEAIIEEALLQQQRVLIGFDFAFGYPAGFAASLGLRGWSAVWAWLHARIEDGADNRSNRFDVAAEMNLAMGVCDGPFWGHVGKVCPPGLSLKRYPDGLKPDWPYGFDYVREAERHAKGAKSVFQLAYNGSVGSQALLGIARLEALRRRFAGKVAIWPFETDFAADLSAPITLAEIYPSAHHVPDGSQTKDQRQVEAVLRDFQRWSHSDEMTRKLSTPHLTGDARKSVKDEEGWILGPS